MTIVEVHNQTVAPVTIDVGVRSKVWYDLWSTDMHARNALAGVTDRAETYLALGVPLGTVLDALGCTEDEWLQRVAERELQRAVNRSAAREMDERRRIEVAAAVDAAQVRVCDVEPELAVL